MRWVEKESSTEDRAPVATMSPDGCIEYNGFHDPFDVRQVKVCLAVAARVSAMRSRELGAVRMRL